MRRFSSVVLSMVLMVTVLSGFACSKATILDRTEDVLFSLKEAQPLIERFLPSASPKIAQAVTIAEKLRDSVAVSDAVKPVEYLQDLIPVFQDIVKNDVPQITDPNVRVAILTALALADIALHYLVDKLKPVVPLAPGATPKMVAVFDFSREPVWGQNYPAHKRKK